MINEKTIKQMQMINEKTIQQMEMLQELTKAGVKAKECLAKIAQSFRLPDPLTVDDLLICKKAEQAFKAASKIELKNSIQKVINDPILQKLNTIKSRIMTSQVAPAYVFQRGALVELKMNKDSQELLEKINEQIKIRIKAILKQD